MSRNLSVLIVFALLLSVPESTWAFTLKVDFGDIGQPVKPGWEQFSGDGNNEIDPKTELYDVGGLSVSVSVRTGVLNDSGYRDYGGGDLGGDMVYPDNNYGSTNGRVILTLGNLPAGDYRLISYHNDTKDTHAQQDPIDVTVSGAITDSTSDLDVVQTKSLDDTGLGNSTVTFTADGTGDVVVTYTPTTDNGIVSKAVLNGFELDLSGPVIPAVEFDSPALAGFETASPAILSVSLSVASANTVTVDYSVTGGTAAGGGEDYDLPAGTLQFDPCEVTRYISISIVDDGAPEGDETIQVTLSNPVSALLGAQNQHTYTILDTSPRVGFDSPAAEVRENTGQAIITLSLSKPWSDTVTVDYDVTGGTATGSGVDYELTAGTLSFDPCETTGLIEVNIIADDLDEYPDETIIITLSSPDEATLGTFTQHMLTILPPILYPQRCPVGDLDENCTVDYNDIRIFANQWLDSSGACLGLNCADFDTANGVNMTDFALLAGNWHTTGIQLVINEFMASNSRTQSDANESDEYPDWVELHNAGDTAIDLSGMYLTDDTREPNRWEIPEGLTIEAGGYLLFWADNDDEQGDTHTSFQLDDNGEQIALFAADGTTLMDVVYFDDQPQNKDVSYGRFPDGSANWRYFDMTTDPHPTPGRTNKGFDIIINEIMYHPSSQDPNEEYIELYNRGPNTLDLAGWRFTDGIDFNFPAVTIEPDGYLVVAANSTAFAAKYPTVTNVVASWSGKLSNMGESIELTSSAGMRIDQIRYADEGDWSARLRGPYDYGHYGWVWSDAHDGEGKSLELINPDQTNWYGQNWAASDVNQGTPGSINSIAAVDLAPMILDVAHSPVIAGPNDTVTVTATIIDELSGGTTVSLHYRVDDTGSPFTSLTMYDDGLHGDGGALDGVYGAVLPSQPDLSVIEFYLEANDPGANSRTWPSSVPGFGQATNLLYQVDASFDPCSAWVPGSQPIHYLILTEQERAELEDLGDDTQNNEDLSDAQMNATFITRDATGTDVRYNVGVRNRGHGSRHEPPMNYRINLPHDRPWKDVTAVNLNSKFAHLQWLGSATFQLAGMPAPDVTIVQVRVNAENLILADSRAYGSYARMEVKNSEWADNHFPDDSDGNVYRCIRESAGNQADLRYEGTDPNAYRDTYFKRTNEEDDDWSDLINLTDILNNAPNETYFQDVNEVINIDEWMRYLALDTLLINCESGLNTGQGDDYGMYRGAEDPRFILVNHDQDTYLRQGDHPECDESHDIFTFTEVDGLYRLLYHPDFVPLYYQAFFDLFETVYDSNVMNQLIDDGLGDYVPASRRDAMKQVIVDRTAGVLAQIPHEFAINSSLPLVHHFYFTESATTADVNGTANAAQTRSVLVDGVLADWSPIEGTWSVTSDIVLSPGINRILVETLDGPNGLGSIVDSGYIDIWYDDGTESYLSGTLGGNTVLAAASGPWHVTGDVIVPAGITLTIEVGTTVFFDSGTGITVSGRLLAEASRYERIRLTNVPGSGASWDGLAFNNSLEDSRLSYADMEFGDSQGESISISSSQVLLDSMTWAGTNSTVLELSNPSLIVRNSTFPSMSGSEVIHGNNMPVNGYLVIEGNTFGAVYGDADVIDFTNAKRPGPILQAYDNVFFGAEDDGIDCDATDAHIEGNVFMNFHYGEDERPTGSGSAIATGERDDVNSEITVVRNIFYDNDHAALLKEGCFMRAENNVFYGCTVAVLNFHEPNYASGPGRGADLDGNIFWNNAAVFQNFDPPVSVTVHRSILPTALHYLGDGNIDTDPLLADPDDGDFSLLAGSPALGTGPNGLDMGAMVPAGASISGEPPAVTYHTQATLTVGGPGIIAYRYRVNDDLIWSSELSVSVPIELSGLADGISYTVYVIGKNSAGRWQSEDEATASGTWTVDLSAGLNPGDVVINEVLAHSDAPPSVDWIELRNMTNTEINLSGWFLSDNDSNLMKYQISNGTTLAPSGYIVFWQDLHFGQGSGDPGSHVAFALSENGETVYLSSGVPGEMTLTDYHQEQEFGASEADVTFGRYYKSSTDTNNFVAMDYNTPGWANSYPKVGPIVISEIMYHPQINSDAEYVELVNISGGPVILYDFSTNEPWKFEDEGGFDFFFSTSPVTIADGNCILLVKNLTDFNSEFTASPGTQIFEWWPYGDGGLRNSSEEIQLSMPGDLDGGERQYIRVDSVTYSDGNHDEYFPNLPGDPWPTGPDGDGKSLTRKVLTDYGNDVINWDANDPSPGEAGP